MRKKAFHLFVELSGKSFVVTKDEGGTVRLGNDIGHGEGLTRTSDTEQHL